MKLWNYKSNDLPKNGLPTRAWRRQPSHQLDKVSEGQSLKHLLNNTGTVLKLQLRPSINMGLFIRNAHWIQLRIYRLMVCNHRAFTLSRRSWVSRSCPRVFPDIITVISLWHHNSCPCDNEESKAAHSKAIPKMGCNTIFGSKGIWIPYKKN